MNHPQDRDAEGCPFPSNPPGGCWWLEGPTVSQRQAWLAREAEHKAQEAGTLLQALTGDLLCGELEEPALEEKYMELAES